MKILGSLLLLLLLPSLAAAQYPRPPHMPLGWLEIALHLQTTRFSRVVVVAPSGGDFRRLGTGLGDWRTTGGALDYVASLPDGSDQSNHPCSASVATVRPCRNWSSQWTILIYPGAGGADPSSFVAAYSETSLTIPSYTAIQGVNSLHNSPAFLGFGAPVIQLTGTTGALIHGQAGGSLANLGFIWADVPAGYLKMFEQNGADVFVMTNVAFASVGTGAGTSACGSNGRGTGSSPCAVDGIVNTLGGMYIYNTSVQLTGNTLGRALVNDDAFTGLSVYGGRWEGESGCTKLMENTAAAGLTLYEGVRLGTGATSGAGSGGCSVQLANSGSGAISVVGGVTYTTSSGTIANGTAHSPFGTTTPAACSPGSTYVNTTSGAPTLAGCTATDTWASAPLLSTCKILQGSGSPESAVTAPVCSLYLRTDGGASTTLYVKTSGGGNTGWTAK